MRGPGSPVLEVQQQVPRAFFRLIKWQFMSQKEEKSRLKWCKPHSRQVGGDPDPPQPEVNRLAKVAQAGKVECPVQKLPSPE